MRVPVLNRRQLAALALLVWIVAVILVVLHVDRKRTTPVREVVPSGRGTPAPRVLASIAANRTIDKIAHGLVKLGAPRKQARPVAQAIYHHTKRTKIDPFLVAAVVSVENPDLNPHARNPQSGATGIMQVMPSWKNVYARRCGKNLKAIDTNVCTGVQVLRMHLSDAHWSIRRGLLAYDGCVISVGCEQYSDVVLNRYHRIKPKASADSCSFIEINNTPGDRYYEAHCTGKAIPTWKVDR